MVKESDILYEIPTANSRELTVLRTSSEVQTFIDYIELSFNFPAWGNGKQPRGNKEIVRERITAVVILGCLCLIVVDV